MESNKKKIIWIVGIIAVLIVVAAAVIMVYNNRRETPEDMTGGIVEDTMTAMYVSISEDIYFLVCRENGMVFTATFPEEMYDIDGNKITQEQLTKGNILKIYGDGIMLESYPGQYPGVSRMEVVQVGTPSDADIYQNIVNEIYQEPDPAEPPVLSAEYTTDLAVVSASISRGGYEWTYVDQDGATQSVVADSFHPLQWTDLIDLNLEQPTDVILNFSTKPTKVLVSRWDSQLRGMEQDFPEGESIEVADKGGQIVLEDLENGYIYEVTGIWETGQVSYSFITE